MLYKFKRDRRVSRSGERSSENAGARGAVAWTGPGLRSGRRAKRYFARVYVISPDLNSLPALSVL